MAQISSLYSSLFSCGSLYYYYHHYSHVVFTASVILHYGGQQCELVSWCFKPSQPQRIIPGLSSVSHVKVSITERGRRGVGGGGAKSQDSVHKPKRKDHLNSTRKVSFQGGLDPGSSYLLRARARTHAHTHTHTECRRNKLLRKCLGKTKIGEISVAKMTVGETSWSVNDRLSAPSQPGRHIRARGETMLGEW